ncbi:MAG TPA: nuclear transport factor 2 family protein [Rugosimonospora sp.]|nr:nuclear transport factor 2 family protein [Rugosimonospora sp.]
MAGSKAAEVATEYFTAWSTKDTNKAAEYLTDDVQIVAPNGTFTGHAGFHDFMDGFAQMLTGVDEFTVFGNDGTALVWYATHLQPVPTLVAGERITLRGGKISRIDVAFDQMPLAAAFGGQAPAHDNAG